MKKAYEGTRNVCSRIACKVKNATDEFWMEGTKDARFRIYDADSAERMEALAVQMDEIAAIGIIENDQWEAVRIATEIHGELQAAKR